MTFTWKDLARPKPCPYGSTLYKRVIDSSAWVAQEKVDGWRVLVDLGRNGKPVLVTRHGETLAAPKGIVSELATRFPALSTVDCELIRPWKKLVALDVLQIAGRDMSRQPLSERMMRLGALFGNLDSQSLLASVSSSLKNKEEFYESITSAGGEGIVLKRLNDPYPRAGAVWLKVKPGLGK